MSPTSPRRGRRSAGGASREMEEAILAAMRELLAQRRFDDISVADILAAAGVSRASFYFYFESRHAVLAVLVRRAVARGHEAAQPWLTHDQDEPPIAEVRRGIEEGARLWRGEAPRVRGGGASGRAPPPPPPPFVPVGGKVPPPPGGGSARAPPPRPPPGG